MTTADKNNANRAIHAALRGTAAQQDRIEDEFGASLSSILDGFIDDAEEARDYDLARRCASAFDVYTGR